MVNGPGEETVDEVEARIRCPPARRGSLSALENRQKSLTEWRRDHDEAHPPWHIHGVTNLKDAIYDYPLRHNADPKLFAWLKIAEDFLARVNAAPSICSISSETGTNRKTGTLERNLTNINPLSPLNEFRVNCAGSELQKACHTAVKRAFG